MLKTTRAGIVSNLKHWNKNLHFPEIETFYLTLLDCGLIFLVIKNYNKDR